MPASPLTATTKEQSVIDAHKYIATKESFSITKMRFTWTEIKEPKSALMETHSKSRSSWHELKKTYCLII